MVTQAEIQAELERLRKQEIQARQISQEEIPQRRFGTGVTRQTQQDVLQRRQQAQAFLEKATAQRTQLKQQSQQLRTIASQKSNIQQQREAFKVAKKLFRKGIPASSAKGDVRRFIRELQSESQANIEGRLKAQQESFRQQEQQALSEGAIAGSPEGFLFSSPESKVPQTFTPAPSRDLIFEAPMEETAFSKTLKAFEGSIGLDLPSGIGIDPRADILLEKVVVPGVRKAKRISIEFTQRTIPGEPGRQLFKGTQEFLIPETKEEIIADVTTFGEFKLLGLGAKLGGRVIEKTLGKGAVKVTEKGVLATGLGIFGKEVFETGKEVKEAGSLEERSGIITRTVKDFAIAGVGISSGFKTGTRFLDVLGVAGKKKLPARRVISERFFEGEKFPERKKGQTAEQFRREFLETSLPGEEFGPARGFTATPKEFASETVAGKGTSSIFGTFVAPKGSATFLGTTGEKAPFKFKDLFSFKDFLTTETPALIRITAEGGVRLGTGVKPSQKALAPFTKKVLEEFGGGFVKIKRKKLLKAIPKKFKTPSGDRVKVELGEPFAPRGAITIPLTKTEAEGIIPFGTAFKRQKTDFFFELEGRRIKIPEFTALRDPKQIAKARKQGKDLLSESEFKDFLGSSSRGFKKRPATSPINLLKTDLISSSRGRRTQDPFSVGSVLSDTSSLTDLSVSPRVTSRRRPKAPSRPSSLLSSDFGFSSDPGLPPSTPPPPPRRRIPDIPPPSRPGIPPPTSKIPDIPPDTPPPPRRIRLPRKLKKKGLKADLGFNVFVKPIKTVSGKKRKSIKANTKPLSRSRAMDVRDFILDTSLSRSGLIRPSKAPRGKAKQFRGIPAGYSASNKRKFRKFRQIKGKRRPLRVGSVIERGKFLLDTRQEVRGITARKRIKQLRVPKAPKRKKRLIPTPRRNFGGGLGGFGRTTLR